MATEQKKSPSSLGSQIGVALSSLTKLVSSPFNSLLPQVEKVSARIASSPGIEHAKGVDQAPEVGSIPIQCIDYGKEHFEKAQFATVKELLAHQRPEDSSIRWINVEGLNPYIINELRKAFDFHTLAAEDVLNAPQRSKFEPYENHCLIMAHMARIQNDSLISEQVSFILFQDILITFQEKPGDVWDPVRVRIEKPDSRFRKYGASYLVYALIDAIVDNVFPILEFYGDALNALEQQAMNNPNPSIQQSIYVIKRELFGLRRSMWPMRELSSKLAFDDTSPVEKKVRTYMRDVNDHAIQIIDLIESCREMANGLQDFYISIVSNRMNEVMKALTVMASLFLPITFLAGVYGMNFEFIPELGWKFAYPTFLITCTTCTAALLWFFKRKGWIGK